MFDTVKSIGRYAKQLKFRELIFRGRLTIEYKYGFLKYNLVNKLNRDKFKIITVNGAKMCIYLADNGISRELYLYRQREKFATEFFKSFLKEDDVIIEIGANIGYYVLLENNIAKKGKIFACEPMTFSRNLLKINVKLNNVENVKIYPFALGDQHKEQEFYIYNSINWSSFIKKNEKLVSTEMVKIMTIDSFIQEYLDGNTPTVLRMDVEGYEYNIIKGALNTIKQCDKMKIFMEIHPRILSSKDLNDLLNILKSNNFKIKAIINDCPGPHYYPFLDNKIWSSIEEIPFGNVGNSYECLLKYLQMGKGTEVFFEKSP